MFRRGVLASLLSPCQLRALYDGLRIAGKQDIGLFFSVSRAHNSICFVQARMPVFRIMGVACDYVYQAPLQ